VPQQRCDAKDLKIEGHMQCKPQELEKRSRHAANKPQLVQLMVGGLSWSSFGALGAHHSISNTSPKHFKHRPKPGTKRTTSQTKKTSKTDDE